MKLLYQYREYKKQHLIRRLLAFPIPTIGPQIIPFFLEESRIVACKPPHFALKLMHQPAKGSNLFLGRNRPKNDDAIIAFMTRYLQTYLASF